jgi:predicted adenylyl cyclase CyaB
MQYLNFEFKARLRDEKPIRAVLRKLEARFVGNDHQVDTYFRVPDGKLKIREGRIENALIFYRRSSARRARPSRIQVVQLPPRNSIKAILSAALGVLTVVNKRREIYFVDNVKIHLDRVRGLGKFVEVEATSHTGDLRSLGSQARKFQRLFGIDASDLIAESYSDLGLQELSHSR